LRREGLRNVMNCDGIPESPENIEEAVRYFV
jgi:hypothetical protein